MPKCIGLCGRGEWRRRSAVAARISEWRRRRIGCLTESLIEPRGPHTGTAHTGTAHTGTAHTGRTHRRTVLVRIVLLWGHALATHARPLWVEGRRKRLVLLILLLLLLLRRREPLPARCAEGRGANGTELVGR